MPVRALDVHVLAVVVAEHAVDVGPDRAAVVHATAALQPAEQVHFFERTGDLPARRSAWSTPALANDPYFPAFREQLERVQPFPPVPEWEEIANSIFAHGEAAIRGAKTPAAALAIPALLKHVDFFCVGTNDLTQYTLAAARDDASVNDYYLDGHESVLRLLGIILADAGGRPVTLCGELAGREAYVPRLLKMGFRVLSVAPTVIPTAKALIRGLDIRRWES